MKTVDIENIIRWDEKLYGNKLLTRCFRKCKLPILTPDEIENLNKSTTITEIELIAKSFSWKKMEDPDNFIR